jgi:hypothetical protein
VEWLLSAEGEYPMSPEDKESFLELMVLLHKPIKRLLAIVDEDEEYFED